MREILFGFKGSVCLSGFLCLLSISTASAEDPAPDVTFTPYPIATFEPLPTNEATPLAGKGTPEPEACKGVGHVRYICERCGENNCQGKSTEGKEPTDMDKCCSEKCGAEKFVNIGGIKFGPTNGWMQCTTAAKNAKDEKSVSVDDIMTTLESVQIELENQQAEESF